MKRLIMVSLVLLLSSGSAFATTYDFNAVTSNTYNETQFNALFSGVAFDNSGGDSFNVSTVSLQPDFSGNAVLNSPYTDLGNRTIATFVTLTNFVSVTMGDYDADDDNLYLNAYDNLNNLITSDFFFNPAASSAGKTLSVLSSSWNIARVEFYGVGANNNSVYWDNFTFNEESAQVPEPASILLIILGLAGLAGFRRCRK